MNRPFPSTLLLFAMAVIPVPGMCQAQEKARTPASVEAAGGEEGLDRLARMQRDAFKNQNASWGHWGNRPSSYSAWTNHSNRLIPVYVFGDTFSQYMNEASLYRDAPAIEKLYGRLPANTLNPKANYADQTDVYRLQRNAIERNGKKYVFLIVFDGMDWQTTQAAAIYQSNRVSYTQGRGTGLLFQDYDGCQTDFGYFVSSPYGDEVATDVDAQLNTAQPTKFGGYDARLGGSMPWEPEVDIDYLIGRSKVSEHSYTDSSSSATSLTTGVKTFNGALNVDASLAQVETIAQWAQRERGFFAGTVTSVPISHATPAAAYAANVSRDDYQDLARDMLGLPSVARKTNPYPGLEVILGGGFGENSVDPVGQGSNFVPGNRYIAETDLRRVDVASGNADAKYVVVQRTPGIKGETLLQQSADKAAAEHRRLLGIFGVKNGHLPFRTANGDYTPVADVKGTEVYTEKDIS